MNYCIYAIGDPRFHEVFYVGETGNFERRRAAHLEGSDRLSGLMIRQIEENGFVPHFVVLEKCPSEEAALMAEIAWIEFFKSRGAKLSNSQVFNGHTDRAAERRARTKALEVMQRAKYGGEKLRHVTNGRSYETSPLRRWSKRELARLKGMKEAGMAPEKIARLLGRTVGAVKVRLSKLPGD